MKGPILPVSAKTGSPRPLPTRLPVACVLGPCWHSLSCWAQWLGFWAAQSLSQENPRAISWVQLSPALVPAPPHSGGGIYKYSELFALISPSSLPPVLTLPQQFWGYSSHLMLKSKHPLFGGGGRHPRLAVTSSSWASSSLPSMALEARAFHAIPPPECRAETPGTVRRWDRVLSPPPAPGSGAPS